MKKILVANRGEIALRIMRTAREMGIKTVAIYSEADRTSPHVKFADQAVCIGPPPANQSYLNIDKIVKAGKQLKVDGIHPGYGFLAENPEFAKAVEKTDIKFIGPKAYSMEVMGNKLAAKEVLKQYDVPLVPGTDEPISDPQKAAEIAHQIGFPVLIKAAAGGGGKGMRVVREEKNLEDQLERAISEAESSFGDGSVFIEKYIESPKHIEIQILADEKGNIVHLFERECSIQRRHQKVVEEAPSPVVTPALREEMGQAAINVAKACDYFGAGTVEFIAETGKNGEVEDFYFLEMNTRLQVEHPVTELVTGIDLVKEQINVARQEELRFEQEDLSIQGHAIQVRVYAEDPANNFLPDIGTLKSYSPPLGHGVRVDDGMEEGMTIPIHYDPMIAKLITYGVNREEAIERMLRAIDEYKLSGVSNTLAFGRYVMQHKAFRDGTFNTHFVAEHFAPNKLHKQYKEEARIAGALAAKVFGDKQARIKETQSENRREARGWKKTGWHRNRLR